MSVFAKALAALVAVLMLLLAGTLLYSTYITNPKVISELETEPDGERARRVMLLMLQDGKTIPVNFLREGSLVYAGADGVWWRSFQGDGETVEVLIQGVTLEGRAIAITDNPAYRDKIFARLRPTAPTWLPEWMKGGLVEIRLAVAE